MARPRTRRRRTTIFSDAMRKMIVGWECYAIAHREAYESPIGEDYVLGEEWKAIGLALLGLLNGELGDLDGGDVDSLIRDIARQNRVDLES